MRYSAFISYNHRDRAAAMWLHRALETYRIPARLRGRETALGPLGARIPPVFRDREELAAGADLAQSVKDALAQSHSLIVICSPNGAASTWVNEEIRAFTALGRRRFVQCLIVDGVANASRKAGGGDPALECLPPALFEDGGGEPLAADIRPGGDGRRGALLKLLAGVLEVPYDELRQRDQARRQQQLAVAAAALGAGFVVMSGLALTAYVERNEAVKQRDIARRKTMTAERTVGFVKSLFELADPSEARGQTVTAREILDRGARRLDTDMGEEPSVRAELGTTLGEVYGGLGLYPTSEAVIRKGLSIPGLEPSARAEAETALGEALMRRGDDAAAVATFQQALKLASDPKTARQDLIARVLLGMGEAQSEAGDTDKADLNIRKALALDEKALGQNDPEVAHDLETLGFNLAAQGKLAEAQAATSRGLAIRLRTQGDQHPRAIEDLNSLGSIAYLQHDSLSAESYYRRALAGARVVLGEDHPEVADVMANLARIELERRDFRDALPLLTHAVAVTEKQTGDTYVDLAFQYDNLGHARLGLGDPAAAQIWYLKALAIARLHKHRNLAPILVDLADLACSRGDVAGGLARLREAGPLMAKTYAKAPWRSAWVEVIEGGCLLQAGRRAQARAELERAEPVVAKFWKADSLYGARASELLAKAGGVSRPAGGPPRGA